MFHRFKALCHQVRTVFQIIVRMERRLEDIEIQLATVISFLEEEEDKALSGRDWVRDAANVDQTDEILGNAIVPPKGGKPNPHLAPEILDTPRTIPHDEGDVTWVPLFIRYNDELYQRVTRRNE